jgi:hypothetical protein
MRAQPSKFWTYKKKSSKSIQNRFWRDTLYYSRRTILNLEARLICKVKFLLLSSVWWCDIRMRHSSNTSFIKRWLSPSKYNKRLRMLKNSKNRRRKTKIQKSEWRLRNKINYPTTIYKLNLFFIYFITLIIFGLFISIFRYLGLPSYFNLAPIGIHMIRSLTNE